MTGLGHGPGNRPGRGVLQVSLQAGPDSALHTAPSGPLFGLDRVWTLDFAFGLTCAGWHGDINGRIPLLRHRRALIMTSTISGKRAYDDGIRDAIGTVTDDWAFRFLGIADVGHVYIYAVTSATPELVKRYFEQACQLGRDFERPAEGAWPATPAA